MIGGESPCIEGKGPLKAAAKIIQIRRKIHGQPALSCNLFAWEFLEAKYLRNVDGEKRWYSRVSGKRKAG